jgi:hypothetical protein
MTWTGFMPSPGMAWGFGVDRRSGAQVIPSDQPAIPEQSRAAEVARMRVALASTAGVIRASRPYIGQQSLVIQFSARLDLTPLVPHFDYDDAATIGYAICPSLTASSRGLRGGDLESRVAPSSTGPDDRIRCAGAMSWGADSAVIVNQSIARFRTRRFGASDEQELTRSVVDLLSTTSWYGATERPVSTPPTAERPIVTGQGCTSGEPIGRTWAQQVNRNTP